MIGKSTYSKSMRIVRGPDITRALRKGGCAADDTLVVFVARRKPNERGQDCSTASPNRSSAGPGTRLGVTIPKKTGNAVQRNLWKRLIRESFRTQRNQLPEGWDVVVRPKKNSLINWKKIQRGLPRLVRKAIQRTEVAGGSKRG